MNITQDLAARVLQIVDQGLCRGVGEPTPGSMCVEAAVCYALGEPHGDNPSCVDAVLRTLNTRLNDAPWSSNGARAKGMRRVAVAQLGTQVDFDEAHFAAELVRMTIAKLLPQALQTAASVQEEPHKTSLLEAAQRCETEGSYEALQSATLAARYTARATRAAMAAAILAPQTADTAAAAADPAQAADAVARAAAVAWAAANTARVAARAAEAAGAAVAQSAARAAEASDQILADFAEEVVQILIKMNTPGSSFLSLTEKEGQK